MNLQRYAEAAVKDFYARGAEPDEVLKTLSELGALGAEGKRANVERDLQRFLEKRCH